MSFFQEVLGLTLDKKASVPLRVSLNVLYYEPKAELTVTNLLSIPLQHDKCHSCKSIKEVTATACTCTSTVNKTTHNQEVEGKHIDGAQANVSSIDTEPANPIVNHESVEHDSIASLLA